MACLGQSQVYPKCCERAAGFLLMTAVTTKRITFLPHCVQYYILQFEISMSYEM